MRLLPITPLECGPLLAAIVTALFLAISITFLKEKTEIK